MPFIIIELIVLALSVVVLYVVTVTTRTVKKIDIDQDNIVINNTAPGETDPLGSGKTAGDETVSTGTGVRNIALFGVGIAYLVIKQIIKRKRAKN